MCKDCFFFNKYSILDVWQGSEYASVIWYSLFGKIEDANKIDSVTAPELQCKFTLFWNSNIITT